MEVYTEAGEHKEEEVNSTEKRSKNAFLEQFTHDPILKIGVGICSADGDDGVGVGGGFAERDETPGIKVTTIFIDEKTPLVSRVLILAVGTGHPEEKMLQTMEGYCIMGKSFTLSPAVPECVS